MVSKAKIKKFLEGRSIYEKVDDVLIDEIIFNQKLIEAAKKEFTEDGQIKVLKNIAADPGKTSMQLNHAVGAYNAALANILKIAAKLGLSPADRKKLGFEVEESDDGFND